MAQVHLLDGGEVSSRRIRTSADRPIALAPKCDALSPKNISLFAKLKFVWAKEFCYIGDEANRDNCRFCGVETPCGTVRSCLSRCARRGGAVVPSTWC